MRAYVGARGPRIGGLRTFGGLSTHVGPTGLSVWLFVVGLVELLVVALERTARLLRVVVVAVWRLADSAGKAVRAQGHVRRSAGRAREPGMAGLRGQPARLPALAGRGGALMSWNAPQNYAEALWSIERGWCFSSALLGLAGESIGELSDAGRCLPTWQRDRMAGK